MERFGVFLPTAHIDVMESRAHFRRVKSPIVGDIAVMNRGTHVGVMLNTEDILHTAYGKDACVERISRAHYYRVHSLRA